MASDIKISQKDYLKKYLGKTKKKKPKLYKRIGSNVKLIDDNIDTYRSFEEEALLETGEDAPVIAAIIDERPIEIKISERYKNTSMWEPISGVNKVTSDPLHLKTNSNSDLDKKNKDSDAKSRTTDSGRNTKSKDRRKSTSDTRKDYVDHSRAKEDSNLENKKDIKRRKLIKDDSKNTDHKKLDSHSDKSKTTTKQNSLKQNDEAKEKVESDLYEMSKPVARYADDKDLDEMLITQDRDGDPMLERLKSKKIKKQMKEGKDTQTKYKGSFPPNRFKIPPSHKWDGVDRSNGFEKRWFLKQSDKKALEEEAYKWCSADM